MPKITKREVSFWSNFGLSFILLIGILIVVNIISNKYYVLKDLTEEKLLSISDQTKKILKELDSKAKSENKKLEIIAFMREGDEETREFERLMKQYEYNSKSIKWEIIDPEKKPQLATKYEVKTLGTVVISYGEKTIKVDISTQDQNKTPESQISNAILKIVRVIEPRVCFTEGHGEKDPNDTEILVGISKLGEFLKNEGFQVGKIRTWDPTPIESVCDLIIVAGPQRGFTPSEITKISDYLMTGGRAIFLSDPDSKDNIAEIVKAWGIELDNSLVIDLKSRAIGASFAHPVIEKYDKEHPITKDFRFGVLMRTARRVFISKNISGVDATEIAKTSEISWADFDWQSGQIKFDPQDIKGPVPVAVAASGIPGTKGGEAVYGTMQNPATTQARLVVFGDSDFISNGMIEILGNKDLILNAVNWVAERGELISIRPRERKARTLVLTPQNISTLRNIFLVALPMIFFALAVVMYIRKRKL
jgi:ABC-type uncharacterized transport system involved in gliding motility auxiliary subunit